MKKGALNRRGECESCYPDWILNNDKKRTDGIKDFKICSRCPGDPNLPGCKTCRASESADWNLECLECYDTVPNASPKPNTAYIRDMALASTF